MGACVAGQGLSVLACWDQASNTCMHACTHAAPARPQPLPHTPATAQPAHHAKALCPLLQPLHIRVLEPACIPAPGGAILSAVWRCTALHDERCFLQGQCTSASVRHTQTCACLHGHPLVCPGLQFLKVLQGCPRRLHWLRCWLQHHDLLGGISLQHAAPSSTGKEEQISPQTQNES